MNSELKDILRVRIDESPVDYSTIEEVKYKNFTRKLIKYLGSENDPITAYLFIPFSQGPHPAVLIHHQHNGERHFGKSEVAGIKGNPLQAFAPALADLGFAVLAPDSICFEDRRPGKKGTDPDEGDGDFLQHFNEMTYRLLQGDFLMRKVLDDAGIALSILYNAPFVSPSRLGVLGHSYGGNTVLFQAAIDKRVAFACSSGAACSYRRKIADRTGLEFSLTIPGFYPRFDFVDLVSAVSPRKLLVVSADDDKYSKDADEIVLSASESFKLDSTPGNLQHQRYSGGHALTQERFDFIVGWIAHRSLKL